MDSEAKTGNYTEELDLDLYIRALIRARRTIFKSLGVTLLLALLYLFIAEPEYESNVVLQTAQAVSYPTSLNQTGTTLETGTEDVLATMEILVSRRVIAGVIEALKLDIVAEPQYVLVFGAPIVRLLDLFDDDPTDLREAVLGMDSFAWGGEVIKVDRLDVPDHFLDESFDLVAKGNGSYELVGEEDEVIISNGSVGKIETGLVSLPNGTRGKVEIGVTALKAREGTRFSVTRLPWILAVTELQEEIESEESAPGIIVLSLETPEAQLTANVLNTLLDVYTSEVAGKKLSQLDRLLGFVEAQLPKAKSNLLSAEAELRDFNREYGGVDITLETTNLLDQIKALQELISAAELLRIDYIRSYTAQHPNLVALENKIAQLRAQEKELNAKLAALPDSEIIAENVGRNVEIASEIYRALAQMQQELSIAIAATSSDIWIVDNAAVADETSSPEYLLLPPVAVAAGALLGLVIVIFTRRNIEVVESPGAVEELGFTVLPIRQCQAAGFLARLRDRRMNPRTGSLIRTAPLDPAAEGLRDLRNRLSMKQDGRGSGLVMLSPAIPRTGESFVLANLLHMLTDIGHSAIVVDAGLSHAHLHDVLRKASAPGLTDVVLDGFPLDSALQFVDKDSETSRSAFLSAGRKLEDVSRLFIDEGFVSLMTELQDRFELVLLNTPPVIGSTDTLLVTRLLQGRSYIILRAGQLTRDEIRLTGQRFAQEGHRFDGIVLYDVPLSFGYGE